MRLCLLAHPLPPEQEEKKQDTGSGGAGRDVVWNMGLDFRPSGVS